jgi:hypothetical protein
VTFLVILSSKPFPQILSFIFLQIVSKLQDGHKKQRCCRFRKGVANMVLNEMNAAQALDGVCPK